ncbi:MAG: Crp/Fnr family transcriptional regulator [Epulopiscium sp.]|mgnify:CR=1 FL=1|nr:Crp/Fnr family transcriptional regulator [Candidatus Epulonipiscium sp.]
MKNYEALTYARLFSGVAKDEIKHLLQCLNAYSRSYKKGEYVIRYQDHISRFILVVNGTLFVTKTDHLGNQVIISRVTAGETFAEALAFSSNTFSEVSVIAKTDCDLLFIDAQVFTRVCSQACVYHGKVISNLLAIISEKNVNLIRKVDVLSKKKIRDRLMSFLKSESHKQGKKSFIVPYNRTELAEYLSVNRSALSTEISKLKAEGVIDVNRNRYTLYF